MSVILRIPIILIVSVCLVCVTAGAGFCEESVDKLGKDLLHELWKDSHSGDQAKMKAWLAKGFQSVHVNGARDREQEIKLLKNLQMGEYKLTDIKATQNGPVIVVSYFSSAVENIDGKRMDSKPAARLTVFLKTEAGWKWMAHANFKHIGEYAKSER